LKTGRMKLLKMKLQKRKRWPEFSRRSRGFVKNKKLSQEGKQQHAKAKRHHINRERARLAEL
jgi:hypothetical protein